MQRLANRFRAALDVTASVAMLLTSAVLFWAIVRPAKPTTPPSTRLSIAAAPLPADPVSLEGAILAGDRTAKVAIIEYSDFECPYCGNVARDAVARILRDYVRTGRVMFAFRHLPLERVHPFALKAAEAAECANHQGKFWEMHDLLFANQRSLDSGNLHKFGTSVGLDEPVFTACLKGAATAKVRADIASAKSLQITGTPTFLLGSIQSDGRVRVLRRVSGALPSQALSDIAEQLLRTKSIAARQYQ